MSSNVIRSIVQEFFDGLTLGEIDDNLLSPDMYFWSVSSGRSKREKFLKGIAALATIANKSLQYNIDALIIDGQRAVAEISSQGFLINGDDVKNQHVFIFIFKYDKISVVSEFMNQIIVAEKIMPLMMSLATK